MKGTLITTISTIDNKKKVGGGYLIYFLSKCKWNVNIYVLFGIGLKKFKFDLIIVESNSIEFKYIRLEQAR